MKAKIVNETTNRNTFNRAYKRYLENCGKIRCAWCKYHEGENYTGNYYGGYEILKYPNWKLISKNSKQWMKHGLKKTITSSRYLDLFYTEFNF